MKVESGECCPICGQPYTDDNNGHSATGHHVFPKAWYKHEKDRIYKLKVPVCRMCHNEFNDAYPMDKYNPWDPDECVYNWIEFCEKRGLDTFNIYPELYFW